MTDVRDLAAYVRSLTGMSALRSVPEGELVSVLAANMEGGVLRVPKEYGMFISR